MLFGVETSKVSLQFLYVTKRPKAQQKKTKILGDDRALELKTNTMQTN